MLSCSNSRGVHRLLGLMATFATASHWRLLEITDPAHGRGPTANLHRGLVYFCRHLPSICSPLPAHCLWTIQTMLHVEQLCGPPVDLLRHGIEHILMLQMLTRTHPDDSDVDPNSSEGIYTILTGTHPAHLPNCSLYSSRKCPGNLTFG